MNKKMFAMMMVPIVVVMGGTFAFSAWSGSANAFFGQSAASMSYTETLNFVGTNAHMTPLEVGNGHSSTQVNSSTPGYQVETSPASAGSNANVYVNVSNLVPGDWAEFTVTVTNTGTATLNSSQIEFASAQGKFFNGNGQEISAPQPISGLQPPITHSYLGAVVNDTAGLAYGANPTILFNATTTSSSPNMLPPGATIQYNLYTILPSNAAASWQGDVLSVEISIPLSAMQ